jgi:capsular polysaccharide export protein
MPIDLMDKGNLLELDDLEAVGRSAEAAPAMRLASEPARAPFLRIPPFPGAKIGRFDTIATTTGLDAGEAISEIRRLRIGGTYWAAQPELPSNCILVRSAAAVSAARAIANDCDIVIWTADGTTAPGARAVQGDCDPWHMLSFAAAVVLEPDDELRVIASLAHIPVHIFDAATTQLRPDVGDPDAMLAQALGGTAIENPFTGRLMTVVEAIRLCGFWRQLIDSNRDIGGGLGFAFWKQTHISPLLWNGNKPFQFARSAGELRGGAVAIWRAKASLEAIADLEGSNTPLIEVEDGFLRSRGLGADCIPPLSITVDRCGAYFDPAEASELEQLIERGGFDPELIARAGELRKLIVEAGIGKYEQGGAELRRPAGERRHVLVPGQVEDDRAVQAGGCGLVSNLELLKRVREQAPDAYILYKPHPDVLAGHRRGDIGERACLEYADEIVGTLPIASLIAMVDEVHVNTSLAGFEALLRGKGVTTYGVPFYAGWGLTCDLGPVPSRRTARPTIDELVAATLLIYPRYLDPVTGLPCPAEIVVARLSVCEERDPSLLVGMRRLQGKLMRRLRSLVQ